jgi:membrane-bound lytic murein transglycosylase B
MNRLGSLIVVVTLAALARGALAGPGYAERDDVHAFIADMSERHGFDAEHLRAQFRKARPSPAVIRAILPAADPGGRSWQAYRARFVEPARIARGLDFRMRHAVSLARAEARFGVPADIVVAIIGIETYFGRHPGRFDAFNALTNLAFDYPPRAALFRGELESLLLLARDEGRDPWKYRSSYAGAIGLPQFLPSSIRRWAVDFDDSGRIDLAASVADAIGSVARFLAEHGWRSGEPVALSAKVSGGDTPNVPALLAEGIRPARLPTELAALGIESDGAPELPAALIDLPTPEADTEYRLGFNNFYVLTRYNRSSFYAAAVMDLAEALRAMRP